MKSWLRSTILSFLILIHCASSQSTIEALPGYPGTLPFKLETGYIGVGENDEVQLFYYFIESERDPDKDPLFLWLTGGPGSSGFSGLVYEIDSPVGTGFSYATTSQAYHSSDTKAAQHNYEFLTTWLLNHPKFVKNPLYIAGDSYAGKIVPLVTIEVAKGIEAGYEPRMLLQGYIVGNPITDLNEHENEKIPYAHRMALVSDETFELAKRSCGGHYVNPDPNNVLCLVALRLVKECTKRVREAYILDPECKYMSPKSNDLQSSLSLIEDVDPSDLFFLSKQEKPWCRNYNYAISNVWANNETVQEALHIRKGTITLWKRNNKSLSYEYDVESVVKDHQLLSEKGFQALVYSGDHDMLVPYMSTLKWIRKLNLTLDEEWRPWTVDGQVAGYTMKYKNNQAYLTFATVKGAGHTAPEYTPKQCFEMLNRWLSLYPL